MVVDLGHGPFELADRKRRAHAGYDVFALRVHQVFTEENLLAGGGIAGEAYARAGVLAEIAENHGLHVDRGAQPVIDVIDAAIGLGAFVLPAPENGVTRGRELFERLLRKVLAGFLLHQLLVLGDDVLQRLGLKLVIELHFFAQLDGVKDVFKLLLRHIENYVAEHLDQAAIGIIRKARIAAALGQRFNGLVIQAEVQNRVHHAGHRELCARAD